MFFFVFLLCSLKSFADILNRLLKLSLQNYENFQFYIFQLMLPKCVLFFLTMKLISSNIKKVQWSLAASLIFFYVQFCMLLPPPSEKTGAFCHLTVYILLNYFCAV